MIVPLSEIMWMKGMLLYGWQIHDGNFVDFGEFHDRFALRFRVNEFRRAESAWPEDTLSTNVVHNTALSFYLPEATLQMPHGGLVIAQWHNQARLGDVPGAPLSVTLRNNELQFQIQTDTNAFEKWTIPAIYDKWFRISFAITWRRDFKIWVGGDQVVDYQGSIPQVFGPFFKCGGYRIVPESEKGQPFPPCELFLSDVYRKRERL